MVNETKTTFNYIGYFILYKSSARHLVDTKNLRGGTL